MGAFHSWRQKGSVGGLMRRVLMFGFLLVAGLFLSLWLFLTRPFDFSVGRSAELPTAEPAALEKHVIKLSKEFVPRDWTHPEILHAAASYIRDEFRRASSRVEFQTFQVQGQEYHNVIAEFGTSDSAGTIIVGAHYDADGAFPAADDNASGVAGLLELSRLLALHPPPGKVLLVAYALEEMPFFKTEFMGSMVHASSLQKAGEPVHLMISLEMIGYFSDAPGSQSYPLPLLHLFYPSRGDFIAVVGPLSLSPGTVQLKRAFRRSVELPVHSINAPAFVPGVDFSDHQSFWVHGFDAVMITDTAFFRNHAYHTAADTAERLDYERMAQVVSGVYAFLAH